MPELSFDILWTIGPDDTDVIVGVTAVVYRGRLESFDIDHVRPFAGGDAMQVNEAAIVNDWRFIERVREVVAEEYGYRGDEDAEHRLSARQLGIGNILGGW